MTVRVAMWSGPRNISTALMRSFGARADTLVVDEPLYAHYLAATGLEHPGRDDVLASQPRRWQDVADALTGPLPPGVDVYYQKHMTHHLLPDVGREWVGRMTNAFLIRDPDHVVASYSKVRGEPTLADLGYAQQVEIFRAYGGPVVDAADLLADPAGVLAKLCVALGIPFDPGMLAWEAGPRETDGVWAPHWYAAVEASTGFAAPVQAPPAVPERLRPLAEECRPYYAEMAAQRLR
ncbi:branched chain amino acid aminotransferase [Virgisporangium aliadipatigenens]|uniref:Branched chain amino acid aminotransferase n=1 Tax=Virgisporangium aliadipatigenens TaxID=741659 RepID=A0A8J4DUY3_9ACTN|nr:HAD family hydrolase [Virgisporangium aliadipatigenens]GIJ50891.1 branched chain amino acid aminotransferase [Virgisporangium aliadipatigenens]